MNFLDPALVAPPGGPTDPAASGVQAVLDGAIGPLGLPPLPHAFTYDDCENRLRTAEPGLPPFNSVSDAVNRYASVNGTAWGYNADGRQSADGTLQFTYDLTGSVQQVSDAATSAEQASYFRDALGRLVAERTPAGTRFYVRDGDRILVEFDGTGRAEYLQGEDERRHFHVGRDGEDYFIHYDAVGSVRAVFDGAGALVNRPLYRPFGEIESDGVAPGLLPVGFAGLHVTPNVPIHHSLTRAYRPDVGRHLQPDPAGTADGTNLYQYAHNDPLGRYDPSGLLALVDDALFWGIGRLAGWRTDSFLSGVGKNFVESWSLVLGTFNTFHGARDVGDVLWGVLKLAHKLTLGLPQELLGIGAGYFGIELFGGETKLWENVQLVSVPKRGGFGAFTLGSKVVGDPTSLRRWRVHEQGHFYQNLVLGPLYIPVIGILSIIHAAFHDPSKPYGHFYTEGWADTWGTIGRVPSGKQIAAGVGIGLGVAAAASILGLAGYQAARRQDQKEGRPISTIQRLNTGRDAIGLPDPLKGPLA